MEARSLFPADLRSSASARRYAERTLGAWGCDALLESARLLISELVANAVLHAGSEAELSLHFDGTVLRVGVRDASPAPVHRRPHSPTAINGRGLMIVDTLADAWGVEPTDTGKTVWFELRLPGVAPAGTSTVS